MSTLAHCMYCGLQIVNRGDPDMGGNHEVRWVHVPGGYTVCYPQRAVTSPRAAPHPDGALAYRPDCPQCTRKES
jgi:hypothetical protein